jgi:predicted CXXCH cytochrome family protein
VDAATINTSTFLLHDGVTSVTGTVSYASATKTATFTPASALLANTTYSATVTTAVKDLTGNSLATDTLFSFATIDTLSPSTTLTTEPVAPDGAGGWFRTAPTITLTASEPAVTYYQFDSATGPWVTYGSPFKALEGTHALFYYSVDLEANSESAASTLFKVDTQAPSSSITDPLEAQRIRGATYTIRGSSSDTGSLVSSVEVSADGGSTWAPATNTAPPEAGNFSTFEYLWTLPADGSYNLKSRAVDTAGNIETPGAGINVVVDNAAPTVVSTEPVDGALSVSTSSTVRATFSEEMDAATVNSSTFLLHDGATGVAGTVSYSSSTRTGIFTPSSELKTDAVYTATVTSGVADLSENTMLQEKVWSFGTVDTVPPVTTMTADPAVPDGTDGWFRTAPTISLTASEPATVYYQWDSSAGTWIIYASPFKAANGTHTLYYYSQDRAGNTEIVSSLVFKVDSRTPSSAITVPSEGYRLRGTSYTIKGTASDRNSTVSLVELSVEGGAAWVPVTNTGTNFSTWEYVWTLPADGTYNLKSRASDNAGNSEVVGAGINVTVDNAHRPPHANYPVDTELCALCHRSHTGVALKLLTNPPPEAGLCYTCHDGVGSIYNTRNDFDSYTSHHPIQDQKYSNDPTHTLDCSTCHNTHGTKDDATGMYYGRLLRVKDSQGNKIYQGNDFCGACHGANINGSGYALGGDHITNFSGLAAHDARTPEPASGTKIKCSNCHKSHGGPNYRLNQSNEEELCFSCHNSASPPNTLNDWDVQAQFAMTSSHAVSSYQGAQVECSSCHGPHIVQSQAGKMLSNPDNTRQLWLTSVTSFCLACHDSNPPTRVTSETVIVPYTITFPKTSGPFFPGWDKFNYVFLPAGMSTAASCATCHHPHGSENDRLAAYNNDNTGTSSEEKLCLTCHKSGGAPGAADLQTLLGKTYKHPTDSKSGLHKDTEAADNLGYSSTDSKRHSECTDCHNPHDATAASATAPATSGKTRGVGGVRGDGAAINPIINEYELCLKCHSSYTNQPPGQGNKLLEFDTANESYHSVESIGKNSGISASAFVGSWTWDKVVYCTDCHGNDDPDGPKGPHGSNNANILKKPYTSTDRGLCFDCHNQTAYSAPGATGSRWLGHNGGSGGHQQCEDCHETHGNKQAHLMNRGYDHYVDGGRVVTDGKCTGSGCHEVGTWIRYFTSY